MQISPNVLSRTVGDEEVLLDLSTELYYGINPTGSRIWQLLKEGKSPREISRHLADEFEITAEEAYQDVLDFINYLQKKGLVCR
jgi:hypothetical protein